MQIKEYSSSAQNSGFEDGHPLPARSASTTDIDFFASMLAPSTRRTATAAPQGSASMLTEATQHLKTTESRLTRALKSSRKGMDSEEFTQYPRELSKVVLTSQLLVKSLGKATQCIDKISNLQ